MATFIGTSGTDTYAGTGVADTITGFAGADTLNGAGDNDLISGGLNADYVYGGSGNDIVFGGGGSLSTKRFGKYIRFFYDGKEFRVTSSSSSLPFTHSLPLTLSPSLFLI